MMAQSGLRGGSWGEVFFAASYLRNRGPVSNQKLIPRELWTGQKPSMAHFSLFRLQGLCSSYKGDEGRETG